MSTTTFDVTFTEVLATIGGSDATVASPSTATITAYILRFAGDINLALRGAGITPSGVTSANDDELYQAIRQKLIARVGAEWYAARTGEVNGYVEALMDEFQDFINVLRTRPGQVAGQTGTTVKPTTYPTTTTTYRSISRQPVSWLKKPFGFG